MLKQAGTRAWVCASCERRAALAKVARSSACSSIRFLSVSPARDFLSTSKQHHQNQSQNTHLHQQPIPPHQQQQQQQKQPHPTHNPVDRSTPGQADDFILRHLFDYPTATNSHVPRGQPTGLFKNQYLTRPEGFLTFANRTIEKAERIVDKVVWGPDEYPEPRSVVRDLDRLSDLLCRVLDLSDFVRMTHPDIRFQEAASAAWALTYQYMNRLNTMTELNDQLAKALQDPAAKSSCSEEELAVAQILQLDFVKSAIHLPTAQRDRFVWLSQRISEVGTAFCADMSPERSLVTGRSGAFNGLHPSIAASVTEDDIVELPAVGAEASAALRGVHSEDTRRQVYLASRTASQLTVTRLEEMLALRAELAELAGFESYAHMSLKDRMMAKSPASVLQFLHALQSHNSPVARAEMETLQAKKRAHLRDPTAVLQVWDRDYYTDLVRQDMRTAAVLSEDELAAYFSVGTVMQGLSRLFSRLYGIRFMARDLQPGETWHPDVRRLDVVDEKAGLVAVLYCDLFARADKSPNPTHFTVRCSREISHEELEEAALDMVTDSTLPHFDSPMQLANDGMETTVEGGMLKQLPTIALVCDFAPNHSRHLPPLLALRQVETLFHEMGHAAHSILARTSLHNVSGTRCATDLAELPSTLMEHFATDPTVLSLFARHWKTGAQLPYEHVADRVRLSSRFDGIQTEYQILLALLDQGLHAPPPPPSHRGRSGGNIDSTALYHSIQRQYATPPIEDPATRWQGFFGHLHGYGSTYYSYLFDRVLAERVWKVVFKGGVGAAAIDRANGEKLKESLLKWGGGRDPWACLSDVLGDDRLASGDEKAMALVGSWGIKEYA